MIIPKDEITFDPSSYIDPLGRVFLWKGRVFRGIVGSSGVEHVKRLMESAVFKQLQNDGIVIESYIPRETVDGFDLLIEHRRVPYLSFCMEWTPNMLKDTALLTLNICLKIAEEGLTLQDASPWNVFFEGTKPVFIDFGSFVPARNDVLWAPYDQFCNFFLYPLYLSSAGLHDTARRFLMDYVGGVSSEQFFRLSPFRLKARYPGKYARLSLNYHVADSIQKMGWGERARILMNRSYKNHDVSGGRKKFIMSLINEIESINVSPTHSYWQVYYEDKKRMCSYQDEDLKQKESIMREIIRTHQLSSVLDLGCNTGRYSFIAAENDMQVIAMDTDEPSVSQLYCDARKKKANILPLIMDVLNPTPSFGWCAKQFPSAIERLKVDMVFAFALIHHLAITRKQGFSRALDIFDAFTNKYVLVEFIDRDDPKVKELMAHSLHTYPWYSFDEFKKVLARRYSRVIYYKHHSPTRRFILYEKQ